MHFEVSPLYCPIRSELGPAIVLGAVPAFRTVLVCFVFRLFFLRSFVFVSLSG
jgi:hypothetical protein